MAIHNEHDYEYGLIHQDVPLQYLTMLGGFDLIPDTDKNSIEFGTKQPNGKPERCRLAYTFLSPGNGNMFGMRWAGRYPDVRYQARVFHSSTSRPGLLMTIDRMDHNRFFLMSPRETEPSIRDGLGSMWTGTHGDLAANAHRYYYHFPLYITTFFHLDLQTEKLVVHEAVHKTKPRVQSRTMPEFLEAWMKVYGLKPNAKYLKSNKDILDEMLAPTKISEETKARADKLRNRIKKNT